jgi:hypothetical protein
VNDTRCKHILDEFDAALDELVKPEPDMAKVAALLNDAQGYLVDIVDGGIGRDVDPADLNNLDAANMFLRRAINFAKKGQLWVASYVEDFVLNAQRHVAVAFGDNVVPLRRNQNTSGGGAA